MTCADYFKWREETIAEAKRQSDLREQALIQKNDADRTERRFKKIMLDLEKEGLFVRTAEGELIENPKICHDEWRFYYEIAQSNIVFAVLKEWR